MADEHASSSWTGRFLADVRAGLRPPPPGEGLALDELDGPPRRRSPIERVEEVASIGFFLAMFVILLIGVFWRYVLNQPVIWTVNLGTVAFIWTVMVGNGLPNWDDDHIQFDLVYDRLSERWQRLARILGNLIIVVTFGMAVPASYGYVRFVGGNQVTGTSLTFDWAFGGVLVFLVGTVLHQGRILLRDVRDLWGRREAGS